jgi:hypothetical protein
LTGDNIVHRTAIRNKIIYRVAIWILLLSSAYVLLRLAPTLSKPEYLPSDDFIPYWAGGNLNINGENPYNPQNIEKLQINAGGQASGEYTISIVLSPPWAMTLVMPFGLINYPISRLIWLIFSVVLILISSQLLWQIYSGKNHQRWLAILVVFMFAPTISALEVGQIAPLLLLGITGFLYFTISRRNDWLAGVFLGVASIKPQLGFIFWIALLFWIIQQRRWLILTSTVLTVLVLTLIATIFNPHIIIQYISMLQTYQISDWANPTIGAYLRYFWFGTDKFWLQYLPPLFAIIWFIYYWYKQHKLWDWIDQLPIILLVSQITTFYTWTYDHVILIPVIIQATIWIVSDWKRWITLILAIIYIGINILDLILHMKLSDFWFIWVAPAILLWYILAYRYRSYTKAVITE